MVRVVAMMRRGWMIAVMTAVLLTGASARAPRPIDATPFAHSPCSVLDNAPCTPSTCSVFNHGPCIPEMNYPTGENLQVTVESVPPDDQAERYRKPDHDLATIGDLFAALRACWTPPAADAAHAGMQMSVLFAFKTSGTLIAPPRLTFASHDVSADTRATYLKAIADSLGGCTPLTLSKRLGGAIAGRPIMIRYVDNRDLEEKSTK